MYSFVPNAPPGLRLPPPTVKGKADMQTLLDTLPEKNSAALAVAISHMLSQFSPDEVKLPHITVFFVLLPNVHLSSL